MRRQFYVCFVIGMLAVIQGTPAQKRKLPTTSAPGSKWRVYTPPDKSFRIETPRKFRRIRDAEYTWAEAYAQRGAETNKCSGKDFVVIVAHFKPGERTLGDNSWELWFLIGGDDDYPISEQSVTLNGLRGKDYFYTQGLDSGCKYRRGRIIDAGKRAYVIIFGSDRLEDLTGPSALRFLNSFRVRHFLG